MATLKALLSFKTLRKRLKKWMAWLKYPDWSKVIRTNPVLWESARREAANGSRVLVVPTLGIQPSVVIFEGYLGIALTLRKANVDFLMCDCFLQFCQVTAFGKVDLKKGMPKRICRKCFNPGDKTLRSTGLNVLRYSEYITEEEIRSAEEIARTIDVKEIDSYTYDGMAIGEHARAGALKYYRRGTMEEGPESEILLRQYLKASLMTMHVIRRLIRKNKYESVVFHHGIYVPEGVIGEVCRREKVRVVNWNPAYRKRSFIFSHNDTYHHTLMSEPAASWENMMWSANTEKEAITYLESRTTGGKDWISFVGKNPQRDLEQIHQELKGIDFGKPTVGLLTNVVWDAQLHYPANIFPNMIDWIVKTVDYFAKRKDLQLVIRIHPAEVLGELPSRQRVLDEIEKRYNLHELKNIFIIKPTSAISTYKIMEQCNAALIYGTKTGVELTSRGIPVIVAGEAWIKNKGLTIDPKSQDEYFRTLDQLPFRDRLPEENRKRALRYAFHFFFRRMIPINKLELTGSIPPFIVSLSDLAEVLPGNDPGMDVICDGVLKGADFVYPAEKYIS